MFYLVYKLYSNPLLWIIKEDLDLDFIWEDHLVVKKNNIELYYIFQNKKIKKNKEKFKRFKILIKIMNYCIFFNFFLLLIV